MLYTKDNFRVTREFGLSNMTKIQEHTRVAARECQLRNELHRIKQELCYTWNMGRKDLPDMYA